MRRNNIIQNKQKIIIGHLCALISVLIWGTTFASTKTLLRDFQPIEIIIFRYIIGLVVLSVAFPHFIKPKSWKEELCFLGAGGTGIASYSILEITALTYTNASNVGVIISTAPFFTAICACIFWVNERPKKNFYLGFFIAIIGIGLISFQGLTNLALNPLGDVLAIGAAISWALYNMFLRKISTFGYKAIQVNQRIFLYGLLIAIPSSVPMGFQLNISRLSNPINVGNLLFLGIGASAFCFVIWNISVNLLGPVRTTVYIYLIPVVTIITSIIFLDEKMTWLLGIGTVLTLLGLLVSERKMS